MTIQDIRDEIVSEIGGDSEDTTLLAKILGYIKSVLRRFPRKCTDTALVAVKTVTLSSGGISASLPSGLARVKQDGTIWYVDSDGNREEIEWKKSRRDFNLHYRPGSSGEPDFCHIYGNTIEFDKKADKAYTIYMECFQEVADVALGDTWTLGLDRVEILKDGVKWLYSQYHENEDGLLEEHKTNFNDGLAELKKQYSRENLADYVEES